MSRFSNPKAAQAMMATHGHTNIGMPPKPGFPGKPGPAFVNPIRPGGPTVSQTVGPKPAPGLRPPGRPTTAGPKPAPGFPLGPRKPTVTGAPAPRPSGPMVPVLGGGRAPASIATMMKKGGAVKKSASAKTSSKTMASRRGDGIAVRGKTKGGIR